MRAYVRGRRGGVSMGPVATVVLGGLFLAIVVSVWLVVVVVAALALAVSVTRSLIEGHRKLKGVENADDE